MNTTIPAPPMAPVELRIDVSQELMRAADAYAEFPEARRELLQLAADVRYGEMDIDAAKALLEGLST